MQIVPFISDTAPPAVDEASGSGWLQLSRLGVGSGTLPGQVAGYPKAGRVKVQVDGNVDGLILEGALPRKEPQQLSDRGRDDRTEPGDRTLDTRPSARGAMPPSRLLLHRATGILLIKAALIDAVQETVCVIPPLCVIKLPSERGLPTCRFLNR